MSTSHDDPQFHRDCHWYNGEADPDDVRQPKDIRWLVYYIIGLCAIAVAFIWAGSAAAGGTVTDSKYIWLQRSGVTLTDKTTPKLACPVGTMTECLACMVQMYDEERRRRTTGYVTYRCLDAAQAYVKFNTTPIVLPPPPPQASIQVYACADAGADGRILESATILWPNCATASYQNPSKSLVVAVNPGALPLVWQLASRLTDERIWTQTDGVGAWVRATTINWGTTAPPPTAGTANLRWTVPQTDVAGYRIVYGKTYAAADDLHPESTVIDVSAATTSYVVRDLQPATYYFTVLTIDSRKARSWPPAVLPVAIK